MKGENDDHLTWPFAGKLTVELLNQLENDNHYCKTMTFPPDIEVSGRVVDEERSIKSWGMPRYIFHSNLGYNASKNCQYLKDDCLYFRISVDANKSSKAWLI
jgi:TNF receptor-associated factor 4